MGLNDTQTTDLIEWVQNKRAPWDKSHEGYKKPAHEKMAIWNILAEKLELESGEYISKQWKNIKDIFVKKDNAALKSLGNCLCSKWQPSNPYLGTS